MPTGNNYRVYGSDEQEKVETLLLQKQDVLNMVDIATAQALAQRQKRLKKRKNIEDTGLHKDSKAIFSKDSKDIEVKDDKDKAQKIGEVKKEEKKKKTSLLIPVVVISILVLSLLLTLLPTIRNMMNGGGNTPVVDNNTDETQLKEEYAYNGNAKLKAVNPDEVWTIDSAFATADLINTEIINYYNEFRSASEAKEKNFSISNVINKLRTNIDADLSTLAQYRELYENYNMREYVDLSIDRYSNYKDMINAVDNNMSVNELNSVANGYILKDKDLLENSKMVLSRVLQENGYEVIDLGDRLSYHKPSEEDANVETHADLQPSETQTNAPEANTENTQVENTENTANTENTETVEVTYPLEVIMMQYAGKTEEEFIQIATSLGLTPYHEVTWDANSDTIAEGSIVKHGAGDYVKDERMRYGLSLGKKQ